MRIVRTPNKTIAVVAMALVPFIGHCEDSRSTGAERSDHSPYKGIRRYDTSNPNTGATQSKDRRSVGSTSSKESSFTEAGRVDDSPYKGISRNETSIPSDGAAQSKDRRSVGTTSVKEAAFVGPAVRVGVSHSATTANVSVTQSGNHFSFDGVGKQSIIPSLGASYTFKVSDSGYLTIGGDYYFSKVELFNMSVGVANSGSASLRVKQSNHIAVYVSPGYKLNEQTMLYGKLAWHQSKMKLHVSASAANGDTYERSLWNAKVNGLGYGLGIKSFFDDKTFIAAEAERINYRTEDFFDLNTAYGTTSGTVYLGHKF